MPDNNSLDLSSLNPISITVGILVNIASSILEHHADKFENTKLGSVLKSARLIGPNFSDRLRTTLMEAAEDFFKQNKYYARQSIVDFLQSPVTSKRIADHILEGAPLDQAAFEDQLQAFLKLDLEALDLQRRHLLSSRQIVDDFLAAYRRARRKTMEPGQIAILEALEADTALIIDEIRQSRDEMRQSIAALDKGINEKLTPYFRIIRAENYDPASSAAVSDFYKGLLPLNWNIITADALIPRDQRHALLNELSVMPSRLEIICLTGEAGDGKSTLAWDIAFRIAQNNQCALLQLRDNQRPEAWYILEESLNSGSPAVVLVDDVFRDERFLQALQNIRVDLPIRVIATSRANEVLNHFRLPGLKLIPLSPPSEIEKQLILERLNIRDLSRTQIERLGKATNWLVLMMETSQGANFKTIISGMLERLKRQDDAIYRAYEYISFAGQYDINMPEGLIERLDSEGRFYRLSEHPFAARLIFQIQSNVAGDFLRPSHALVAQEAFRCYHRDPENVLGEIVYCVDLAQQRERSLMLHLLTSLLANDQVNLVRGFVEHHQELMEAVIASSGHIELLNPLTQLYRVLGNTEVMKQLIDRALELTPNNSFDWEAKFAYLKRVGTASQIAQVLEDAHQWLEQHDEDVNARSSYLMLMKERGTPEQIPQVLDAMADWLARHDEEGNVRSNYLVVIKEKGSPEQVQQAIEACHRWLADHDGDVNVRSKYLILVKEKGTSEQTRQMLEETREWLERHDDDVEVRSKYPMLVRDKGTAQQIQQALEDSRTWLARHDRDVSTRSKYLILIKDKGTPQQIQQALEDSLAWLAHHDEDIEVRKNYLALVKDKGTPEHIEEAFETTWQWLARHDEDVEVRGNFLTLIKDKGTPEQIHYALEIVGGWLKRFDGKVHVRRNYLALIREKGTPEQIGEILEDTHLWLERHPEDLTVRRDYLALIRDSGTPEQIHKALEATRDWLVTNVENTSVRSNYLLLIKEKEAPGQINAALESTRFWLEGHQNDVEVRRHYLSLAEKGSPDEVHLAVEMTRLWLKKRNEMVNPNFDLPYGLLLMKISAYEEAMRCFRSVCDRHRSHVWARIQLAWSLYHLGNKASALKELKQADWHARNSQNQYLPVVLQNLGEYAFQEGDYPGATIHFSKARKLAPDNPEHAIGLGRTRIATNQRARAIAVLEEALGLTDETTSPEVVAEIHDLLAEAKKLR